MSQYNSRVYIKNFNQELWNRIDEERIKEFHIPTGLTLSNNIDNIFIIDDFWSLDETELLKFVNIIVNSLEGKCIVIADTTNINVDAYVYYSYYLGDKIKDNTLYFEKNKKYDEYMNSNIYDIENWVKLANVKLNKIEKENLSNELLKFSYSFPIELVYTNLGSRINDNENLELGQIVFLDKGSYSGKSVIEVFTNDGKSIGFIDEFLSKDILKVIKKTNIKLTGKICEYVPLSKRSKRSTKALIKIKMT